MAPVRLKAMRNVLMELRKVCQHPHLSAPELEDLEAPEDVQHKQLIGSSGKLAFLKVLFPKLKEKGHRVLLFSQFKIALDKIEDFLHGEGYKFLRLDGDVQQAKRQKSMDLFNAPGSDYFIFLLTTRAGGVGINLATADTVIVHDPDFNPHQDQQAIARAHRYGQTKPVMVFKLMMKDSVEERIIEKTKKKLVLDHLIVQNLHKENDEGDIDDMILHGAKALYDTDAEGRSAHDIIYTSKMVDELIEKVKQEAADEVKAAEEREKARENGAEEGGEIIAGGVGAGGHKKELMSFGFAKIWEAGKAELAELSDDEVDEDDTKALEDQEEGWSKMLENIKVMEEKRKAEEAEEKASRKRRRKEAPPARYQIDGPISDGDSPAKLKKGKGKSKGKGKIKSNSVVGSDGDFALPEGAFDTESDISEFSGDDEVMMDDQGRPIILMGGKNGAKKRYMDEMSKRVVATIGAPGVTSPSKSSAIAGPSNATAGPSVPPPAQAKTPQETSEERAARKAKRKEERRQARLAAQNAAMAQSPTTAKASRTAPPAINAARIAEAQTILQWLYQTLDELGLHPEKRRWAIMGVKEVEYKTKRSVYNQLARIADKSFVEFGQLPYFDLASNRDLVHALLKSNGPIIPDPSSDFIPDVPARAISKAPVVANQQSSTSSKAVPNGTLLSQGPLPGNQTASSTSSSVPQRPPAGPVKSNPGTSFTSPVQPLQISVVPIHKENAPATSKGKASSKFALSNQPIVETSQANRPLYTQPQSNTAGTAIAQPPQRAPPAIFVPAAFEPPCPFCKKDDHVFAYCDQRPDLADVEKLVQDYGNSTDLAMKMAVREAERIIGIYQTMGYKALESNVPGPSTAPLTSPLVVTPISNGFASSSIPSAGLSTVASVPPKSASVNGHKSSSSGKRSKSDSANTPVSATNGNTPVIDLSKEDNDDDNETPRPSKRTRIDLSTSISTHSKPRPTPLIGINGSARSSPLPPTATAIEASGANGTKTSEPANPSPNKQRGRPKLSRGCTICNAERFHIAKECPVVRAGPESISRAMVKFDKNDAQYDILKKLLGNARICPFCGFSCSRSTVRECATAIHGDKQGRKKLKDVIRQADIERAPVSEPFERAKLDKRMSELYTAYQSWPK